MSARGDHVKDILTQHLGAITKKEGTGADALYVLKKEY